MTLGKDVFDRSTNEKNRLVVSKDDVLAAYDMNLSIMKSYDYNDHAKATEATAFGLYCLGADEADKPNLLSVLDK